MAIFIGVGMVNDAAARTINYNAGGLIGNYHRDFDKALIANEPYRIKGTCLSACTIFLGLPRVCVYPNAVLGFHGAWPKILNPQHQRVADAKMGNYLPPQLKAHFMQNWRHKDAISFKVLTGKQVVALQPGMKLCR